MTIEYVKRDSTLHRLDPRTKLLMAISFTFIALAIQDPLLAAIVFIALWRLGIAAVGDEVVNKNLKNIVPVFVMFGLFNVFFRPAPDGVFLFYLIPYFNRVPIVLESLIAGIGLFFRFITIVLAVHLLLYTTPSADMVLGMTKQGRQSTGNTIGVSLLLAVLVFAGLHLTLSQAINGLPLPVAGREAAVAAASLLAGGLVYNLGSRGIPPEIAMGLSIGFATLGLLTQETEQITDAQQARGYDVRPKNIIERIKVIVALVLPMFFATIERAQNVAVAIQARAFDYNIKARTYRRALFFHSMDYIFIVVMVGLFFSGLALNHFGLHNPTERLVKTVFGL